MNARKLNRALHRDIGYSVAALVIAYSLSGLAVNHIEDWNPKYKITKESVALGAIPPLNSPQETANHVITKANISQASVKGHLMVKKKILIFLKGNGELSVNLASGNGTLKTQSQRPVIAEINALHLNELKGIWTYVADLFAILLLILAITGTLIPMGKSGIKGRGKYFLLAGFAVPLYFIFFHLY